MIKTSITIDESIEFLNELIKIDKPAMAALFANRVPCNELLADHPTVQVMAQHGGFSVGMLGVLNGMFGVDENGSGAIALMFDDTADAQGNFRNLVGATLRT